MILAQKRSLDCRPTRDPTDFFVPSAFLSYPILSYPTGLGYPVCDSWVLIRSKLCRNQLTPRSVVSNPSCPVRQGCQDTRQQG